MIILFYLFAERVGAKVVECACVIELPELKVFFASIFQSNNFFILVHHVGIVCMTLSGVSICLLVAFWFLTVCFRTLSSSTQEACFHTLSSMTVMLLAKPIFTCH
jgi:hypothetical protein